MEFQIEAEQWPMAAGCIGLAKLYPEEDLPRTPTGIILHTSILNTLAEKFIRTLIDRFSIVKRDVNRLEWFVNMVEKKPERTKSYAADVRKAMNEQYKKVKKYFPETDECKKLGEILEKLKSVKDAENYHEIRKAVEQYEEIMSTPFINEKLTLNYAKAVILQPFFGQTSILQPSFNSKSTEEHIAQIEKDFVHPAKIEMLFADKLLTSKSKSDVLEFLKDNQEYKPLKDLIKPIEKMSTKEEVNHFLDEEMLPCSFIDALIATQSYEEMTFSPLSLSKAKAVNFSWNFDKKLPVPISAVARLVMLMAPIGMAFYTRRLGNIHASEMLRFAGIILSQNHFAEMIKENITYQTLRGKGSSFGEAIVGLIQESIDKAKKIKQSYLFLEMYSEYQTKKTLLDYYHLPNYLVHYLHHFGKALELLHHRELKDVFFRSVLKGIDPKETLFSYLRIAIHEPYHAQGAYHATRERMRILLAKKGVEELDQYDKLISYVYYRGIDLRNEMSKGRTAGGEDEPYRASGRKKLEGIAYRLLNSAKAGSKEAFMDTIFRVHMAANLDVPSIFIDSFKEEGLDFQTISAAFIAGMLGQEKSDKKEGAVTNG